MAINQGRPSSFLEEGACASVILTALKDQQGVVAAELNADSQQLSLQFDPSLVDMEEARAVTDRVAVSLSEFRRGCPGEGGAQCAACALNLATMLTPSSQVAEASPDRIRLRLAPEPEERLEVSAVVAAPSEAVPAAGEPEGEAVRPLLVSTVLCGVFLMAGYVSGTWLGAPGWLSIALYVVSYITGGYFRLIDGFKALWQDKNLDINFLMLLGAAGAAALGRWEEGAVLMFLFTLSATLEVYAVGRTRTAIRKLMALAPEDALVRRRNQEYRTPVDQLRPGDRVIVKPGERIPADGVICSGTSAVNEAAITGESIPTEKSVGEKVFAGTVNGHGGLEFEVSRLAGESTLARIIRVVEEAQSQKAASQRITDWIDRYYTAAVVVLAGLAWVLPPLLGWKTWHDSFYLSMMLLVVASPCALVISTPAAILSGIARAARGGILFKGGLHLEQAAQIQVVAFDKTGTLTSGRPGVVEVMPEDGIDEEELLRLAAVAESRSEHPLAHAVLRSVRERGIQYQLADEFEALAGLGARAVYDGEEIFVGAPRLLDHHGIAASESVKTRLQALYESGLTTMVVIVEGRLLGILGLADTPRPEARQALERLRSAGVQRIVMLTGDNRRAAQAVAEAVGVDDVRAELLPEDKLQVIRELEVQYGPVAMVGDGVNDAPALAAATVGIAMGGVGSDVAMETADLVLMADELEKISEAFSLARKTRRVILQNLVFAIGVIVVLVVAVLAGSLTLPLAVIGHEGSTILVAFNGLRLLGTRFQPVAGDVR